MLIIRSKAPLRMSFSGGGTDVPPYCSEHGGQVTSTSIDKYVYLTGVFSSTNLISIHAFDLNEEYQFFSDSYSYDGHFDLIKAVVKNFEFKGGCELFIHSDLPAGSGMGTSSSLVVALIELFARYAQKSMSKYDIAKLACYIERQELKQTGGYQDQYAAAFGGFNYITFRESISVHPIHVSSEMLNELNYRMVLCYTGKTHLSADIQNTVLKNYDKIDFQEGMKQLKVYADELRDLLSKSDLRNINRFGEILHQSWIAKQRLSSKISTDLVEKLYVNSLEFGAIGGKLLGAGGGGFLLLFVEPLKRMKLIHRLTQIGGEIINFHFENDGVSSWIV